MTARLLNVEEFLSHRPQYWRVRAHLEFDSIWQCGYMKRTEAYAWLSRTMGLPGRETHIEQFDEAQCAQVIEAVKEFFNAKNATR